jgi:hypothetical protein
MRLKIETLNLITRLLNHEYHQSRRNRHRHRHLLLLIQPSVKYFPRQEEVLLGRVIKIYQDMWWVLMLKVMRILTPNPLNEPHSRSG